MGEETILASQRLAPSLLQESGFEFEYPTLAAALTHELNSA
jgi:NAD dependent epimerase/dehydratase family enzyme